MRWRTIGWNAQPTNNSKSLFDRGPWQCDKAMAVRNARFLTTNGQSAWIESDSGELLCSRGMPLRDVPNGLRMGRKTDSQLTAAKF